MLRMLWSALQCWGCLRILGILKRVLEYPRVGMRCLKNVNGFIEVVFHYLNFWKSSTSSHEIIKKTKQAWAGLVLRVVPGQRKQEKQEKQTKNKEKQTKSKFYLFFLVFCLFFLFSWAPAGPQTWSRPETRKQEKQEKQAQHKEKQTKSKFCLFPCVLLVLLVFPVFLGPGWSWELVQATDEKTGKTRKTQGKTRRA